MRAYESAARHYLAEQLGPPAPRELSFAGLFDESPLEGEGRTAIFSFTLPDVGVSAPAAPSRGGTFSAARDFYVAVGETTPNFFPSYALRCDDAYSFHIGQRFAVELALARVDRADEPRGAREDTRAFVRACAPGATIADEQLASLFRCAEQLFAVYRLTLNGEPLYCLGADCPPGFYRMTEYPPQVALYLHLGKVIRSEAQQARREARGRAPRTPS